MSMSLKVHEFAHKDGREVLVRTNPYVRLTQKDEPPYIIQSGCVYGDGGGLIEPEDVPEWVWDRVDKMVPRVRDELRIKRPGGKAHPSTKKE